MIPSIRFVGVIAYRTWVHVFRTTVPGVQPFLVLIVLRLTIYLQCTCFWFPSFDHSGALSLSQDLSIQFQSIHTWSTHIVSVMLLALGLLSDGNKSNTNHGVGSRLDRMCVVVLYEHVPVLQTPRICPLFFLPKHRCTMYMRILHINDMLTLIRYLVRISTLLAFRTEHVMNG